VKWSSTNATAVTQSALDALTNGGVVQFGSGTFPLAGLSIKYSRISLVGSPGYSSVLSLNANANMITAVQSPSITDITISNLYLAGNHLYTSVNGVVVGGISHFTISENKIYDFTGAAIATNSNPVGIYEISFNQIWNNGQAISDSNGYFSDGKIIGNNMGNQPAYPPTNGNMISLKAGDHLITNNHFWPGNATCVYVRYPLCVSITDNRFEGGIGATNYGINLYCGPDETSKGVVIANNRFIEGTTNHFYRGISLNTNGPGVGGFTDFAITGNIQTLPFDSYGLVLYGTFTNGTVTGNVIHGGTVISDLAGSNVVITGNSGVSSYP
jgi:hypothetical protein